MKQYWWLVATVVLSGCLKVPDTPPREDAATDMQETDAGTSSDGGSTDAADVGPTTEVVLPLPTLEVGLGDTYNNGNTIRYLRRQLMYRFNANVFVGTTAQVAGRQDDFDAVLIESADEVELASLASSDLPVFMNSYVASDRLGLTQTRDSTVPLLSVTLTPDHPNPDPHMDRVLERAEGEVFKHPSLATGATVYATGDTGTEMLPVMLGVDTGELLFDATPAPARRGYFAGRQYTDLSIFGEAALLDAIAWTFGQELPEPDKMCGMITAFDDRDAAFAERLKLHGCDVRLLEPGNVDSAGLDLVVIGPGVDEIAVAQLLAPQDIPVVAFYEGDEIARGLEMMPEDVSTEPLEVTSVEILPRADELLGTDAAGTLALTLTPDTYRAIPAGSLVEDVEVIATFANGEPAVFAVDRGITLTTLDTKARFVLIPTTFLRADAVDEQYGPFLEPISFVDYAIQWTLAEDDG